VCDGHVHQHQPQRAEPQHDAEADALGVAADDQRRRDHCERQLEHEEDRLGQRPDGGRPVHPGEQHAVEAADPRLRTAAVTERQGIARDEPQQRGDACDCEALDQHRQRVLAAHEAAVEQRQPGQRHQQHQRRRRQHPRGIRGHDGGLRIHP
jgi:hypothetical protein